jgi:hypothetical protein
MPDVRVVDVVDVESFALVPPCADPGFDHRSCDYWEDAARGSKAARSGWLSGQRRIDVAGDRRPDNPFAPGASERNPFAASSSDAAAANPFARRDSGTGVNPFARRSDDAARNPFLARPVDASMIGADAPPKLGLLARGLAVFGSYAKVLLVDDVAAAYTQYGPLTAYPRAQRLRDLYPTLPQSPPPAVITCIATTPAARDQGWAAHLVRTVCEDLAARGFVAVEAYPDVGARENATSAATPSFWAAAGFAVAAEDLRFPVMRRELA